jgi:hypothetical protein
METVFVLGLSGQVSAGKVGEGVPSERLSVRQDKKRRRSEQVDF